MLDPAAEAVRHRVAIAGSVHDAITQQPIVGAKVEVIEPELQTLTREDGSFYFLDLPGGQYRLRVSTKTLGSRYETLENLPEVTVKESLEGGGALDKSVSVLLSPTCFTGQVTAKSDDAPIVSAKISLRGSENNTLSDSTGQYTLTVQAGRPTLMATAPGFQLKTRKIAITAGEKKTANFKLE